MTESQALPLTLDQIVDGQKVRFATVSFLLVATLALIADGFDLSAIGYVGPELVKHWRISPAQLAPIFSAGVVGMLLGAPVLGYLGDKIGRKKAILAGLLGVGAMTLLSAAARSPMQLGALRFLAGVGLGGVIPNVIALTAEVAPLRLRGMFIVIVNFGVPAGLSLPGLVSAALMPRLGWPVMFVVGGVLPLMVAALVSASLPESMRYMALRGGRERDAIRLALSLRPDLPASTPVLLPARAAPTDQTDQTSLSPRPLFTDGLAGITGAIWVALAANQMANFFALSWLPILLRSTGASIAHAGISSSLFSLGGLLGGLSLTFIIDRTGILPILVLFVLGAPLIALMGMSGSEPLVVGAVIACAGFCVTGINFGMNAVLGMIYPTAIRSLGTGWAQGCGRLGALSASIVSGVLLALHLPTEALYLAPAAVLACGAVAALALAVQCIRRYGGYRIPERPRYVPPHAAGPNVTGRTTPAKAAQAGRSY